MLFRHWLRGFETPFNSLQAAQTPQKSFKETTKNSFIHTGLGLICTLFYCSAFVEHFVMFNQMHFYFATQILFRISTSHFWRHSKLVDCYVWLETIAAQHPELTCILPWGCSSSVGTGKLFRIDGNMDRAKYGEIPEEKPNTGNKIFETGAEVCFPPEQQP